jgi:hypothetical protein
MKGLKHLSWKINERFKNIELIIVGEKRKNKVETTMGEFEDTNKSKKMKKKWGKLMLKK